ncbi:hypothetical protein ACPOL_1127 [Acidisarcina polymorpha]|uniref:Uncharacterized protein n=1 Tax=Acidisarcina polymorpha TaxID=2211140 RepID=A0A2Z5FVS8_9BACT|nr:hypothetical protein [Acidisarcina polymorpha]AXC10475.1 hypothetical protein ACPOL_1127 [Acidisarcina polymorpha]
MSFLHRLAVVTVLIMPLLAAAQKQAVPQPEPGSLEKTAQLVGVLSEFQRLQSLSSTAGPVDRWEVLWLHEHVGEQIMATSLQVDATIAQIDNEIARANEVHSYLSDRRDRAVNRANLFSVIVGGGLGATSSGLQLSSTLEKPAAAVGIAAGALSASLAIAGIHAQKGKSSRFGFESNMLAKFFDRPALPDSQYPATIWTFLNEHAPTGPPDVTRKQQLLQTWIAVRRIDSMTNKDKIDRLTSEPDEMLQLSIDDFEDRAAMLQDVRARISFLKRDLGELMGSLAATADQGRTVNR